jgi:Putative Flp pilus-assembly TadE/G-like
MNNRRAPRNRERGSVLVVALCAVMMLAGAMYLVMGRGDAIEHRNRGQMAADAAAIAGADAYANAMNLLVHTNMGKLGASVKLTTELAAVMGGGFALSTVAPFCCNPFVSACCAEETVVIQKMADYLQELFVASGQLLPDVLAADGAQQSLALVGAYADARVESTARSSTGVRAAFIAPALAVPVTREETGPWCSRVATHARPRAALRWKGGGILHPVAAVAALGAVDGACPVTTAAELTRGFRLGTPAGNAVPMGSPYLQVPVYVLSEPMDDTAAKNLVKAARWGWEDSTAGRGIDDLRWKMSQVHVAQAEYFYNGDKTEANGDGVLWHQKWKARLKRFRPEDLEPPHFDLPPNVTSWFMDVCPHRWSTTAGVCAEIDRLLTDLRPTTIH